MPEQLSLPTGANSAAIDGRWTPEVISAEPWETLRQSAANRIAARVEHGEIGG